MLCLPASSHLSSHPCGLQVEEAKAITFGMPDGDVPAIFKQHEESDEADSDVEIIEDDRPAKKRIVLDLC